MITNSRVYGLEESIIASGYPMSTEIDGYTISEKDMKRAGKLGNAKAGSGHDCYLKGIVVQFDLTVPQYIWMQMERYHFADIVSSQSKMHRITKMDLKKQCNEYVDERIIEILQHYIDLYNENPSQGQFHYVVSNCPMGYNLTARITTNYLQLKTIYNQRRHHKMQEWHEICDWMETLPMFRELCLQ